MAASAAPNTSCFGIIAFLHAVVMLLSPRYRILAQFQHADALALEREVDPGATVTASVKTLCVCVSVMPFATTCLSTICVRCSSSSLAISPFHRVSL